MSDRDKGDHPERIEESRDIPMMDLDIPMPEIEPAMPDPQDGEQQPEDT